MIRYLVTSPPLPISIITHEDSVSHVQNSNSSFCLHQQVLSGANDRTRTLVLFNVSCIFAFTRLVLVSCAAVAATTSTTKSESVSLTPYNILIQDHWWTHLQIVYRFRWRDINTIIQWSWLSKGRSRVLVLDYIVVSQYNYRTEKETSSNGSHSCVSQSPEVIQPRITIPRIVPITIIELL